MGRAIKAAARARSKKAGAIGRTKVDLVVDRALKQRWEEAAAALDRARGQGASAFDELWEMVGEVIDHDPPLYLAAGIATAREFLRKYTHEPERTAKRFIRVARYASPAEEERHGVAKLDAAIGYVEAKLGTPAKGRVPVDFKALRIPVEREGQKRRLPLEDVSVEELRAATRALTRAGKRSPGGAPPIVAAITRALPAALRRDVKVSATGDRVSLTNIPAGSLRDLARALAKAKLA